LTLKPAEMEKKWVICYKMLALLLFVWAMVVLVTETTLIFGPQYTLLNYLVTSEKSNQFSTFVVSVIYLSGVTLCCFFTIFNLKFSDYLQLRKEQTDCIQMASITGLCSTIINVIVYNYMVICGEI
jgi:hypothetical protein